MSPLYALEATNLLLFWTVLGPSLTLLLLGLKAVGSVPWSRPVVLGMGVLLLLSSWTALSIAAQIVSSV